MSTSASQLEKMELKASVPAECEGYSLKRSPEVLSGAASDL